jgi:hypothetical protein
VGHPVWWEDRSVIYSYNSFWALPEQSLSGPSPAGLVTIFYCLIWGQVPVFIFPRNRVAQLYPWTLGSFFIVSYYSSYSGGILTCLHNGSTQFNRGRNYFTTDGQSVSMAWYQVPLWDVWPNITSYQNVAVWNMWSCFCGARSLTEGRVCNLQCNHSMVRVAQNP